MASKSNKAIKISQKHLLGIQDLSISDVNYILSEAKQFIKLKTPVTSTTKTLQRTPYFVEDVNDKQSFTKKVHKARKNFYMFLFVYLNIGCHHFNVDSPRDARNLFVSSIDVSSIPPLPYPDTLCSVA